MAIPKCETILIDLMLVYLSISPTWCRSIINVDCSAVISLLPVAQNILLQESRLLHDDWIQTSTVILRKMLESWRSDTYQSIPRWQRLLVQNFQCEKGKQLKQPGKQHSKSKICYNAIKNINSSIATCMKIDHHKNGQQDELKTNWNKSINTMDLTDTYRNIEMVKTNRYDTNVAAA